MARPARYSDDMQRLGVVLLLLGVALALLGALLVASGRVPWLGRLPGDIHIERGNWSFYFPLGTSLLVSVLLTLVLWLVGRR
jgi:hypothetical protein